ncbi:MAG: interleukin-like EMT inducer domain-containing protein, partial [Candidatus Rokuibacteriota bacterium]
EQGFALERWVSYDFLVTHPVLEASVRPVGLEPGRGDWVDVALNGRPLTRISLDGPREFRVRLRPPFRRAAPNVIRLAYGYDLVDPAMAAREIGATGVRSPVDLVVVSGGQPHGDVASVRVNTVERAPNRRGYNLVALDPAGRVLGAETFDTFLDSDAAGRLAGWLDALPSGTIVAGAVKDEASLRLDATAVRALRTIGVPGSLTGRFRESHGFVGVKGAPAGSALEGMGARRVTLAVGIVRPTEFLADGTMGVELTSFALRAARLGGDRADAPGMPRGESACDGARSSRLGPDPSGRPRGC